MKRICLVFFIIFAVLCIVLASVLTASSCAVKPLTPLVFSEVNYNNYTKGSVMDYRDGRFVWIHEGEFAVKICVVDQNGDQKNYYEDATVVQLAKEHVIFMDEDDGILRSLRIADGETAVIAEEVYNYYVVDNTVFYCTRTEITAQKSKKRIAQYDIPTMTTKVLLDGSLYSRMYLYNERPLISSMPSPCIISSDGTLIEQEIPHSLFSKSSPIYFCGNDYVYTSADFREGLTVHNSISGQLREHAFAAQEEGEYILCDTDFICDDSYIYYTYRRKEIFFLSYRDIDNPANGVWRLDPATMEATKISEETYDQLYLFGGELIGYKDGEITLISSNGE